MFVNTAEGKEVFKSDSYYKLTSLQMVFSISGEWLWKKHGYLLVIKCMECVG